MLKSYLTVALRSLRRHRAYSFINIAGLAVGMACVVLIFLYVQDERSYDQYHVNKDRIYRLATAVDQASELIFITDTDGRIEYVNPSFERITGYTRREVLGQNPRILKSGQHDGRYYEELWQTITRGDVWHGRLINRKKDIDLVRKSADQFGGDLSAKVRELADHAEQIVEDVTNTPSSLGPARRLLDHYLPEFTSVTERFVTLSQKREDAGLCIDDALAKYEPVVEDMLALCDRQTERNLSKDAFKLDLDMDVLRRLIKVDGV